jgi:hypothetical protein
MRSTTWLTIGWFGCGGTEVASPPPEPPPPVEVPAIRLPYRLTWDGMTLPREVQTVTLSSPGASLAGEHVNASWQPLLTQGQRVNEVVFGVPVDENNAPLPGEPACPNADFGALFEAHGEVWHLAHVECQPGALWLTRVQVEANGTLTPMSTAPVPVDGVAGVKLPCAGVVTPWGTVLSGEEYDVDARRVRPDGTLYEGFTWPDHNVEQLRRYYVRPPRNPDPYDHGWMVETAVLDAAGATRVQKRYAMGRFSHETAVVMPDRRTVYLTDDGVNGALFLFVADRPDDLTSGRLYAARWTQADGAAGGRASLSWVSLGAASEAEVAPRVQSGTIQFDDLFDYQPWFEGEPCPSGFTSVHEAWGAQCLRIRAGADDKLVSRLEARRYAALRGATTEFRKMEGVTYDPDHGVLYVALSELNKGMVAKSSDFDAGGPDHVQVGENRCGAVYALPLAAQVVDTEGVAIESAFVAHAMSAFVVGRPDGFGCDASVPANPDNLVYIPGSGTLMIAEDTPHHPNNLLWSVDVGALHAGQLAPLAPVLLAPPGAEVTGMAWNPNLRGRGYLTASIQHPWEGVDATRPLEQRMGIFGYFGPLPAAPTP